MGIGWPECRRSAVEDEPAQGIAQPLVIEDEVSDLVGQLVSLPPALSATGLLVFSNCASGPDRVCGGAQLVGRHVAHRGGLAGGVRGMPGCPTQVPGRGVGMAGRSAGLSPPDLTPRPRAPQLDGPAWTVVPRPCLLEEVEHMLRAVGGPRREEVMIRFLEAAAATHGDEPGIADLGQNHSRLIVMAGFQATSHTCPSGSAK